MSGEFLEPQPAETENLEKLKEIAHRWQPELVMTINLVIAEGCKINDLIDIFWQKGILDRVAPEKPEIKQAREKVGAVVYSGSRQDLELYVRLIYSAKNFFHDIDLRGSLKNDGYMTGLNTALGILASGKNWQRFFGEKNDFEVAHEVINEIIEKAKLAFDKTKDKEKIKIFQEGDQVEMNGMEMEITGFTSTGDVYAILVHWLKDVKKLNALMTEEKNQSGRKWGYYDPIPLKFFYQ